MGSKSKKGGNFERETAKFLSFWWTDGDRDDVIWHTHSSGGRATQRMKTGLATAYQYGDLCPTDPVAFPLFDVFLFELKRGYTNEVDLLSFTDKANTTKDPILFQWWQKAEKEKKAAKRLFSLIIIKRDRHRRVVMFSDFLWKDINRKIGESDFSRISTVKYKNQNLVIVLLEEFCNNLVQEVIIGLRNDYWGRGKRQINPMKVKEKQIKGIRRSAKLRSWKYRGYNYFIGKRKKRKK